MTSRFPSSISAKRAVILGALAAFGVVAWSGCGPGDEGRYYCDASGCHQCDAYGCSDVTPPTHQTCTGTAGCAPGSTCTSTGCATTCTADTQCPKGEVCKTGVCSAPAGDPGTKKECTTKTDCTGGKVCVANVCQACGGSAGPCPCTAKTDCESGQACVAGACTAAQNECKFSGECGDGKICADGQCLASCGAAPCADGFTCDPKGVCRPTVVGGGCTVDATCPGEAPKCVSGACSAICAAGDGSTCNPGCGADSVCIAGTCSPICSTGKYCDQNVCVTDTRPHPNCTSDDQCGSTAATPKKCLGGYCKYTCPTDQYCRTIDNRIGYCAKDGVCRTESEAHAACVAKTDCTAPADCIDNQCK